MQRNKWIIAAAFCCCGLMVIFPQITATAAKKGIGLWFDAIVPTLFPFFIMANFIKGTGVVNRIPVNVYPFTMALLSGYPMGAKIAGDYYRDETIGKQQLYAILSYSMITGPAFLIGTVGLAFFGAEWVGYILAVSHYAGALINGVFYHGYRCNPTTTKLHKSQSHQKEYSMVLTDAILESFQTIVIILAYVMMFMILTDLLDYFLLADRFQQPWLVSLSKGILEMTVGCSALSQCQIGQALKLTLVSFCVSFGGMSVMGQSMSMLRSCPVTLPQMIKIKFSHGVISGILTFTIYAFVV